MTELDAGVIAKLKGTTTVTLLVGSRIYPDNLPLHPKFPAITVTKPSDIPDPVVPGTGMVRVQVTCWSNPETNSEGLRSPAEVESVATAVKNLFHIPQINFLPYPMKVGTVTYRITKSRVHEAPRLYERTSGYYQKPVDVILEFRE